MNGTARDGLSTAPLFTRATHGRPTERTPIWLMRQAGRTDPEYRRIREDTNLPLEQLFRTPELAARITLLPERIGVDALILFQDILTPLGPMGAEFRFAPGPQLDKPVRDRADIAKLALYDVGAELRFVSDSLETVKSEVGERLPVLGFAGAPFTLAAFLIEGKSFSRGAGFVDQFLQKDARAAQSLLEKLTALTVEYLMMQIEAGADAVQLFESAATLLSPESYRRFALPWQQRVMAELRGRVPTIIFARDWSDLDTLAAAGADILSLSSALSIRKVRQQLGPGQPLQGNLDNRLLAEGTIDEILRAAHDCIVAGGHHGHIFNLSHGLLPHTPFENIKALVRYVRTTRLEL